MTTQPDGSVQSNLTTPHFDRVRKFMFIGGQGTPERPTVPDKDTALLRSRIILEEALETVNALGVSVHFVPGMGTTQLDIKKSLRFEFDRTPDLVGIADGCADISVVTTGTLVALGIPDNGLLELVDENNLAKYKDGVLRDEYGKILKPPGHKPPDIAQYLATVQPIEN
jgi:predicted HAD superfamily Cof-like phosphohydrolase